MKIIKKLFLVLIAVAIVSCVNNNKKKSSSVKHPDWTKNKNIYEVNIRQYTDEGDFKSFEKHLPRLKQMGVDILWIMPVQPIGEKNKKGSLGSYYSIKDYLAVNPEFGTMDDFKHIVDKAHELKMYVILDWVANHTSWDNNLITEHPEWYTHDSLGNIVSPVEDWTDVADLNYYNNELRTYMINALEFWVKQTDIDGFRCDVAGMVPTDFWNDAREKLDKIKPVFMLAEWESPELQKHAFDMTYSWALNGLMNDIAKK
ncbi:MAG: alpha-amylase, partial [Bacteroidales bacterium]|nr:alpha-amylase [Bacteroidales bacterium]